MEQNLCDVCGKTFSSRSKLTRHVDTVHTKQQHRCDKCGKNFSREDIKNRHRETCQGAPIEEDIACIVCGKNFTSRTTLTRHVTSVHRAIPHPCQKCGKNFSRIDTRNEHSVKCKGPQPGTSSSSSRKRKTTQQASDPEKKKRRKEDRLWQRETLPTHQDPEVNLKKKRRKEDRFWQRETLPTHQDPEVNLELINNQHQLRPRRRLGRNSDVFVYAWPNTEEEPNWREELVEMYKQQKRRFKINASHGLILRHKESGEIQLFHPSVNNHAVFTRPRVVHNRRDFERFVDDLHETDILEHARQDRPNTKWEPVGVSCTSFMISTMNDFPIGCGQRCKIPDSVKNNKAIHILVRDKSQHDNPYYNDNLCLFRCLALYRGKKITDLEAEARSCYGEWCQEQELEETEPFDGISLGYDLVMFEAWFQVCVEVYELDEDEKIVASRRSVGTDRENTFHVLHVDGHYCYIKDIEQATSSYPCNVCDKLWTTRSHNGGKERHQATCSKEPKQTYPGGIYAPQPTIMELLQYNGVDVSSVVDDGETFTYPYYAAFDMECYFNQLPTPEAGASTRYTAEHVPLSVSIASNVPGFTEPVCFIISEEDPQELIDRAVDHLNEISDRSFVLLKEQFKQIMEQLVGDEDEKQKKSHFKAVSGITKSRLLEKLLAYLKELPVVGFNSGRYDLPLIKPYLITKLLATVVDEEEEEEEEEEEKKDIEGIRYVIKKNTAFTCIATEKLKFLDICNYLAPGFNYAKYLKAYEVAETKGFFPYEWMTSPEKLKGTTLPDMSAFSSTLKNTDISPEEYAICQRAWEDEKMVTMEDFLRWYNNKDVIPFIQALRRQIASYAELGLDMLKDAISIPGVTMRYLMKTIPRGIIFPLINERNKCLHTLIQEQTVGGPSLIFHRYHETGVTKIRGGKTVRTIEGYDANGLYTWALKQPMPTDFPIILEKENNFKPRSMNTHSTREREWLTYYAHLNDVHVQHKFNRGQHSVCGRLVDGWIPSTQTVLQFHGCFWHGHECQTAERNAINGKTMRELREKTEEFTRRMREEAGVSVVEMWECQWEQQKHANRQLRCYLATHLPRISPVKIDQTERVKDVKAAVLSRKLYGLVLCDIRVPDHLKAYFEELQPIFKNVTVGRADIGDFMRQYAEKRKLLSTPRRTLIASYFGKEILLATPLLKWYMENGLELTEVYLVVQYRPEACFETFVDHVADARRKGDNDPTQSIVADTFKLLGNSA